MNQQIAQAVSTASAGFEQRGSPVGLVYTIAQKQSAENAHTQIVAACIANIGKQSKGPMEVIFSLENKSGKVTVLHVPMMPGEVSEHGARAIVNEIGPGQQEWSEGVLGRFVERSQGVGDSTRFMGRSPVSWR